MKNSFFILFAIVLAFAFGSCKEQDGIYKEYVVENGYRYPQKAMSPCVKAGYGRLRVQWLKAKDPTVVAARIYWNSYKDSLDIDLKNFTDTITVDISKNIGENSQTFYIFTFDEDGNKSIPVEVSGTPYTAAYIMNFYDRKYKDISRSKDMVGTITMDAVTNDLVYTEIRYQTNAGEKRVVKVMPEETTAILEDVVPGSYFEYRSAFMPANGIDLIVHDWQMSLDAFSLMVMYDRTGWIANSRNGYHPWKDGGDINNGAGSPAMLLDGNINTGFHSKASPVPAPLPQVITIDMLESITVKELVLKEHRTASKGRLIKDVHVYLSDTELPADAPDASWPAMAAQGTYDGTSLEWSIGLPDGSKGRYLVLVFPNSRNKTYINFMELEVWG
jgi:hypothetical protein